MRGLEQIAGMGIVLLLSVPASALGQESAVVRGTVTDSTGAVIPGAEVTVVREATDEATTGLTNESGNYEFIGLPPGLYTLTVEVSGFQTGAYSNVELRSGQPVLKNFSLKVGTVDRTLVVVGTRAEPRSVTESTVPIDAISPQEIVRQGDTDLSNQLRTVIPSYNVSVHPIADAATIVRPASLRNLAPEHTLVLVNGKRRHRSSVIAWQFGSTVGNHGPDISTIPSIALRQVEVLRDGASAQYGSDAIAGVINFQLKDANSGGRFEINSGTYGKEGGGSYTFAGNVGFPIGQTGFANLSLEYGNTHRTDVSIQRADAAGLIAAGNNAVATPAQPWGAPDVDDDLKFFGNFGHSFANGLQLYGHTNYAGRKVTGNFFYRNPTDNALFGDGEELLVGDRLQAGGQDSANCPTVPIVDSVPDPEASTG